MAASGHLQVTWPDHPGTHAEKLIRAADFDGALAAVEKAIAEHPDNSKLLRIKHDALMGARRFDPAVLAIEQALALKPGNSFYRKLHGIALKDAGRFAEALPLLLAASADKPADVDMLAALCVAHFRLGDEQAALDCGQRKLDILAEQAALAGPDAPPAPNMGKRDVIAFSLWGSARQYCEGAVLNARQLADHFPGWLARFYVDQSVPPSVVAELRRSGAEAIDAGSLDVPPAMWRFLVHDDPGVRRYLIRDSDSRLGAREALAVEAWTASGKLFHALRDHPFHHDLILAGLWGGMARHRFVMADMLHDFRDRFGEDRRYGADQYFLGRYVWPAIREQLLTHDSFYRAPGSEPLPDDSRGSDTDHIGMGIVLKD